MQTWLGYLFFTVIVVGGQIAAADAPFDVIVEGYSAATDGAMVQEYGEAGATWWDERQVQRGPDIDSLAAVLRRVELGPPGL